MKDITSFVLEQLNTNINITNTQQLTKEIRKVVRELHNPTLKMSRQYGGNYLKIDYTINQSIMYQELLQKLDDEIGDEIQDFMDKDGSIYNFIQIEEDGDNFDFWGLVDLDEIHEYFKGDYNKAYEVLVRIIKLIDEKY